MRKDPVADRRPFGGESPSDVTAAPTVDGYAIERELGRGGEAIVYLARDLTEGRRVAIKVLHADLTASIQAERFLQEITIISTLVHPNILTLLRSGSANGRLYYVLPYVEGQSLRTYLQREGQLRIADAVRIVREVAYALDYACRQGVVHRDIKPENILLVDRHAFVADFGVAHALTLAGDDRLTAKGLAVGTPAYMSPEQAGSEPRIDGRSDIYSLGCVLYELLAGTPPFTGSTPHHVIRQHMAAPVPSLRLARSTVPRAMEDVIVTALAKAPADRYSTAAEFGDALGAALSGEGGWRDWGHRMVRHVRVHRVAATLTGLVMMVVGALLAFAGGPGAGEMTDSTSVGVASSESLRSDATYLRLAVLAVDGSDTLARRSAARLMREALKRWTDLTVEDELRVTEALGTWRAPVRIDDAGRVATAVGAGRYVRVGADRAGDSLTITAGMYDARSNRRVADRSLRVAASLANAEPAFAALADSLLLPAGIRHTRPERTVGTRSILAREAYLRGHTALVDWDLPLADSMFDAATQRDPQYAQAMLWLAQLRNWRGRPLPLWNSVAVRASAGRARLDPADTLASDALLALAEGRTEQACDLWRRSTESNRTDFAAWYGYANCLRRDDAVLRDSTGPTKWRFRSSYNATVVAYQHAFQLLPSVGAFNDLAQVLKISRTQQRGGRALPPDTTNFRAYPTVEGDSIVFIPFRASAWAAGQIEVRSEGVTAAILRYRELYRDIALGWRSASPNSSDALEAVATSLELFGDASALDTLRAARLIATQPDDRVRLAGLEVWMLVKASLPRDKLGLTRARALADSVLERNRAATAPEPGLLSSLASLLGQAALAAEYARVAAADGHEELPGSIRRTALALLAFAALGGPGDSLAALESGIEHALAADASREGGAEARDWLMRAATIAFPEYRSALLRAAHGSDDYLAALQALFLRGDSAAVRQRFARIREARRAIAPSDLTFDALYPEASVLGLMGDARGAAGWLDPTLASLSSVPAQVLADADGSRAGPLVRAAVLRAELANRLGDRATARRYAEAVVVLWTEADAFLLPTVNRMKMLAR